MNVKYTVSRVMKVRNTVSRVLSVQVHCLEGNERPSALFRGLMNVRNIVLMVMSVKYTVSRVMSVQVHTCLLDNKRQSSVSKVMNVQLHCFVGNERLNTLFRRYVRQAGILDSSFPEFLQACVQVHYLEVMNVQALFRGKYTSKYTVSRGGGRQSY